MSKHGNPFTAEARIVDIQNTAAQIIYTGIIEPHSAIQHIIIHKSSDIGFAHIPYPIFLVGRFGRRAAGQLTISSLSKGMRLAMSGQERALLLHSRSRGNTFPVFTV